LSCRRVATAGYEAFFKSEKQSACHPARALAHSYRDQHDVASNFSYECWKSCLYGQLHYISAPISRIAPWPLRAFSDFFREKKAFFWAAKNTTKNGTVLGRPGIRFSTLKIITKGAKISRK
jgi:hypothetical protein